MKQREKDKQLILLKYLQEKKSKEENNFPKILSKIQKIKFFQWSFCLTFGPIQPGAFKI